MVGNQAAIQIQETIKNIELRIVILLFWGIMLLIGASGVFAEIQSSINYFGLKAKPIKVL
jgi:membrane protein